MEVTVLASGSSGNAALIRSAETALLVDVGVSARQVGLRLGAFGLSCDELSAILLTHEHSDHVCGTEVLLKRHPVPVWATAGTWSGVTLRSDRGGELCSGRELRVGALRVLPVATSHDAREPVALLLDDGRHRVALCTDTGTFTGLLAQRLAGCDLLLIEANHDRDMLFHGAYPWPLKQRIASRLGHLNNEQTREAVEQLASSALRSVVGLHLSAENNDPSLAHDTLRHSLGSHVSVAMVDRAKMLRITSDDNGWTMEKQPVPPSRRNRRSR